MIWLAIWVAGVLVICLGGHRWMLRDEPTAQGQMMGRQVLFVTSALYTLLIGAVAWWQS